MSKSNTDMDAYNSFCKEVKEGSIIYNIDNTNDWGEYLLVVNKVVFHIAGIKTYSLLLLGLQKSEGKYKPRDLRINITPECVKNIPFLKYVGYANYELLPSIHNAVVHSGLVATYSEGDLHKYAEKFNIRKPQSSKYGKDGYPITKKLNNYKNKNKNEAKSTSKEI